MLSLGLTNGTVADTLRFCVFDSAGNEVDRWVVNQNQNQNQERDLPPLAAGRYTVLFQPDHAATGTVQVALSTPASGGTLVRDQTAKKVTITRAGQNGRFSFQGTADERLQLKGVRNTIKKSSHLYLIRPDGTTVNAGFLGAEQLDANLADLTATGAYQLVIDPAEAATGEYEARLRPGRRSPWRNLSRPAGPRRPFVSRSRSPQQRQPGPQPSLLPGMRPRRGRLTGGTCTAPTGTPGVRPWSPPRRCARRPA